jgi:hypothetical protein
MVQIMNSAQEHLTRQRDYVKSRQLDSQRAAAASSSQSGLVDERMLAETMRSVRYQDEAHAAGDIIDNAIEAGASRLHIVENTEGTAIKEIAFIDDGSGIDESFLPHSTKWGGSSNQGQRNVFGRFGFGLPSASVNRGRKFSVYSRTEGGQPFAMVTLDLDNLVVNGHVVRLPTVSRESLPNWVVKYLESEWSEWIEEVRTIVVWSHLDKLQWPNKQQSTGNFRQHLGITYAGWLDVCKLFVNGEAVEPVDVLFTTPDYRYYDIEGFPKGESHSPIRFDVSDENGNKHEVTVRFSLLGVDAYKASVATGGRGRSAYVRQKIRTEYNGIFVTRNGRFIELAKPNIVTWSIYSRQVGVAIDFPPELDDLFGVTPDKQTIIFKDRLNDLLEANGVVRAFRALVAQVQEERHRRQIADDAIITGADSERPSEIAIAKTLERDIKRTRKATQETQDEAQKNFRERVKDLSRETGVPEEIVEKAQEQAAREKPYKVEFSTLSEDDPFYTPMMVGTQLILRINTAHPWYRELYSRLRDDQSELRSGLELMLWVLATSEIDANSDTKLFYRAERREWSRKMADAFDLHPTIFGQGNRDERDSYEHDSGLDEDNLDEAV